MLAPSGFVPSVASSRYGSESKQAFAPVGRDESKALLRMPEQVIRGSRLLGFRFTLNTLQLLAISPACSLKVKSSQSRGDRLVSARSNRNSEQHLPDTSKSWRREGELGVTLLPRRGLLTLERLDAGARGGAGVDERAPIKQDHAVEFHMLAPSTVHVYRKPLRPLAVIRVLGSLRIPPFHSIPISLS